MRYSHGIAQSAHFREVAGNHVHQRRIGLEEVVKEIVMSGILNSAETAAVTNDPMHVESIKDSSEASMHDEYVLYEVEIKLGKGVLFVTQNLPVEMSRLQVLSDFI